MSNKVCPQCETINPPHALVCSNCGSTFTSGNTRRVTPIKSSGHTQEMRHLTSLYSDSFVFFVVGDERPLIVPRTLETITIGRNVLGSEKPTVDLLDYGGGMMGVSRLHAAIMKIPQGYALKDLSSTNGTWVNETRLMPETPHLIYNGDKIRLGQITLYVYFSGEENIEQTFFLVHPEKGAAHPLTGTMLFTGVAPFVRALSDLQRLTNEALDIPHQDVEINAITATKQNRTISVNIVHAGQALRLVKDIILPWKHHHAEAIRSQSPALPEYQRALALELVGQIQGNANDEQQMQLAQKLMPLIQTFTFNLLEISSQQTIVEY